MAALAVRGAERKETVLLSRVVEETGAQHKRMARGCGSTRSGQVTLQGAGGRGGEMSWTLKEQECPHWGREGGLPTKGNFLGKDVVLGKKHGLFRRG